MGFSFGNLSLNTQKKLLGLEAVEPVIKNNFQPAEKDYFLILMDSHPTSMQVMQLEKALKKYDIRSYIILNAVNILYTKEKVKGSLTDFMLSNQSSWEKYTKYEGKQAKAVLCFGSSLYAINHGTEVMVEHFYDYITSRTYYYSPRTNCNVFPVDNLREVFPLMRDDGSGVSVTNYKTRFMHIQLEMMKKDGLWMPDMRDHTPVIITTAEECSALFKKHMNSEIIVLDTEDSGLDFTEDYIGCITITFDGVTGYFIPWKLVNVRQLSALISSCKHFIGANLKFDVKFLWMQGCRWPLPTDSTDELAHALNSDRFKGLKSLAFFWTKFGGYDEELDTYKKQTKCTNYTRIPTPILSQYAILDAIVTYRAYIALRDAVRGFDKKFPNEKMPEWTVERWYNEVMMPVYRDFCEIEYQGIYIDMETREKNKEKLQNEITRLEGVLRNTWNLPSDFNLFSSKELGKLFQKMGWTPIQIGADGIYSTADECLSEWEKQGNPGIKDLKTLRTVAICLKSFLGNETILTEEKDLTGWSQYIRKHKDGSYRVHSNYKVMQTETFRCISANPNLQNIPAHGPTAKTVKQCITSPDKELYRLCTIDFGSLQCRLATIDTARNEAGIDPMLFELYKDGSPLGADMHTVTAYNVFCEPTNRTVLEVLDEATGKTWIIGPDQKIMVGLRAGTVLKPGYEQTYEVIFGRDLKTTDTILDYYKEEK